MFAKSTKYTVIAILAVLVFTVSCVTLYAQDLKMAYVDLRRAFYEYDKTKKLESELTAVSEEKQKQRGQMVEQITKMREEMELLSGEARDSKQRELQAELAKLQEFDRTTRQELLNRKNDMFKQVIDDIQKVVEDEGAKSGYDYIIDSRYIMYAKEGFDITDKVVKELNK